MRIRLEGFDLGQEPILCLVVFLGDAWKGHVLGFQPRPPSPTRPYPGVSDASFSLASIGLVSLCVTVRVRRTVDLVTNDNHELGVRRRRPIEAHLHRENPSPISTPTVVPRNPGTVRFASSTPPMKTIMKTFRTVFAITAITIEVMASCTAMRPEPANLALDNVMASTSVNPEMNEKAKRPALPTWPDNHADASRINA